MTQSFQSNLCPSRLENLLKLASNADQTLNSSLSALTNNILWNSFERHRSDNNWKTTAKIVGEKIRNKINNQNSSHASGHCLTSEDEVDFLQHNIDTLESNLVNASKKILSMSNRELLNVIKTNHLHGIKYALNYILNPIITPRRQVPTITPRPYKELAHSISTDHLV